MASKVYTGMPQQAGPGTRGTVDRAEVQHLPPTGAVLVGLLRRAERLEQEHRSLARELGELRARLGHVQSVGLPFSRPPAAGRLELSGTLEGLGLGPLVQLLAELSAGGTLTIQHGPLIGLVFFEAGRVIGATFGHERGWTALEAIGLLLGHGRFVFTDATPRRELNLILEPQDLQQRLRDVAEEGIRLMALVPSLTAVPRLIVDDRRTDGPIWLDRSAITLIRRIDGRQTVADLVRQGGLVPALKQLARLVELELIELKVPRPRPAGLGTPARPSRAVGRAIGVARELAQLVVLSAVVFVVTRPFAHSYRVDGLSMAPTLEHGQMLLIDHAAYWRLEGQSSPAFVFGGPQRGEVAVVHLGDGRDLIKRIIGLPGDMVLIDEGVVFVNGSPLDEPYVSSPADDTYPSNHQPTRVPDGSYFVLGDNRPYSADSRLGWFVPAERLVGRAWLSYWPPTRWGLVPTSGQ